MSIQAIRNTLGDYAKDTRVNLGTVLSVEGAPDLTLNQIFGVALASAYATKNKELVKAVQEEAHSTLTPEEVNAAKSAATIMGMNNIYYRFTHLVHDAEVTKLPAKLRMNVIGSPGIAKVDFELMSLAVSAINGCGMCMESHVHEVVKGGVSKLGAQSSIRIASVIHAAAQALFIESLEA